MLQACRAHGLTVREPYGVCGGLTEEDRDAIYAAERREHRVSRATAKYRTNGDGLAETIQLTRAG